MRDNAAYVNQLRIRDTRGPMSQENVELVQLSLRHFAETGQPFLESLDPEVEVYDHDIPDAGTYRGPQGFMEWLADWSDAWGSFSLEPERWIDAGEKVVFIFLLTATGKGSGVELKRRDGMVWTLRDEKVVRLDYYNSDAQALAAAGID